jgi:hypothetical protein
LAGRLVVDQAVQPTVPVVQALTHWRTLTQE